MISFAQRPWAGWDSRVDDPGNHLLPLPITTPRWRPHGRAPVSLESLTLPESTVQDAWLRSACFRITTTTTYYNQRPSISSSLITTDAIVASVARLGETAPTGRFLAAVGALKFGFVALLATFGSQASVGLHI